MFSEKIIAWAGELPFRVEASASYIGKDISICVFGGTSPHIGAVSLAVYEPMRDSATVSTVTVHSHRDDSVAAYFAKAVSREMKCTVTVSAGLHVDNAGEKEIKLLWSNAVVCCAEIIKHLNAAEGK